MNKSTSFQRDRRRMIERVNVFVQADEDEGEGLDEDHGSDEYRDLRYDEESQENTHKGKLS